MALNLSKGENINLSKQSEGLRNILVGAGWDPDARGNEEFDLDLSAFLLDAEEKLIRGEDGLLFYGRPKQADGTIVTFDPAIVHSGDSRDGEGDGDDERIKIDLAAVDSSISKILFVITIYEAQSRNQTFGRVRNAFIRIVDEATREEIVRYDLAEDFYSETGVRFGQLYRYQGDWKFRAIGEGQPNGIQGAFDNFS